MRDRDYEQPEGATRGICPGCGSLFKPWRISLRAIALVLAACAPAYGDTTPPQQDLYLNAMRSIAEGRQYDANDALARMIELVPQHAGAWLDLAIIQCELGHATEAERLFKIIESRFSPPPGILEVIAARRTAGCSGWQPRQQILATLGRGTDSNVNQGSSSPSFSIGTGTSLVSLELSPEYLPQHDQYTYFSSDYRRDLTPNGSVGFAQLRVRQNDSLTHYDTTSLVLGAEKPWRFGEWGVRGTGSLGILSLGGQWYQKQEQLQARILPPVELPSRFEFSVLTSLSHIGYPTLNNFDSNMIEASSALAYRGERTQIQAGIGLLSDRRAAAAPGGDRHGWYIGTQGHTHLGAMLDGELGWSRQNWFSQSAYSPGLIDQTRHQDTQLLRAALIWPLAEHHSLQLEWRLTRNDENIDLFKYESRLWQLSWQWQGF